MINNLRREGAQSSLRRSNRRPLTPTRYLLIHAAQQVLVLVVILIVVALIGQLTGVAIVLLTLAAVPTAQVLTVLFRGHQRDSTRSQKSLVVAASASQFVAIAVVLLVAATTNDLGPL